MRIWDISPAKLCRNHLLGEHNELHAMWNILTQGKAGYSNHPETKRWKGKLKALFRVHEEIVQEMLSRGYNHKSPLDKTLAKGSPIQTTLVDPVERQVEILKQKGCDCDVIKDNTIQMRNKYISPVFIGIIASFLLIVVGCTYG